MISRYLALIILMGLGGCNNKSSFEKRVEILESEMKVHFPPPPSEYYVSITDEQLKVEMKENGWDITDYYLLSGDRIYLCFSKKGKTKSFFADHKKP